MYKTVVAGNIFREENKAKGWYYPSTAPNRQTLLIRKFSQQLYFQLTAEESLHGPILCKY